jgi:2-polyprenyl-6-methoxyphenol hydroxylase-like FAD-dependent oxidoreductase
VRGNARTPLYVLPQDVLEQALEGALESLGVQVLWRCEAINTVDHADHVTVSMDQYKRKSAGYAVSGTEWTVSNSQSVDVPFVVGADGFHSGVRRSLGIDFPEVAPSSCYAIFEFVSDARCAEEVRLITGPRTTDVLWPLGNGSFRWSFELPDYNADVEPAATYRHRFTSPAKRVKDRQPFTATGPVELLSETQLSELIRRRAPWFDAPVEMITWRTIARFERRLASEFGKGRCWLVGDAAHLTGPVGVQSMNVGFQEAHELSTLLTQVLHSQAPLSVLQNYAAHWSSEWRQLLGIDDGVPAGSTPDSRVEENRARLASCLPAYGADLFALADQIGAGF